MDSVPKVKGIITPKTPVNGEDGKSILSAQQSAGGVGVGLAAK